MARRRRKRRRQAAKSWWQRFSEWMEEGTRPPATPSPRQRTSSRGAREQREARLRTLIERGPDRSAAEDRELANLFERVRRNPGGLARLDRALRGIGLRRNPDNTVELAQAQSWQFHGSPAAVTTVRGRPKVVIGELESVEYRPPKGSQRSGTLWRHEAGDQGEGRPRLKGRAKLVADPKTGKVNIEGGPMRFDSKRGIVG